MEKDNRNNWDQHERTDPAEDLDVEISSLEGGENLPNFINDPPFIARKYRRSLTIVTVASGILALLIIFLNTFPINVSLSQLFPTSKQTGPRLSIQANPGWGQLYIDGKKVALIHNGDETIVPVSGGRHELVWLARPFSSQRCEISLPPGSGPDSCIHPQSVYGSSDDIRLHIIFTENLLDLPSYERDALTQAVQASLDQQQESEMVQVGEPYTQASEGDSSNKKACKVTGRLALCFTKADQPLRATLKMQLSTNISATDCALGLCQANGANCHLFCDTRDSVQQTLNPFSSPMLFSDQAVWRPFVLVHLFWQFSSPDGKPITTNQPDTFILGMQNEQMVQLIVNRIGDKWDVMASPFRMYFGANAPVCEAAQRDVYDLLFPVDHVVSGLSFLSGPTPTTGCLIQIEPTYQGTPALAHAQQGSAYLMQHFGVLVAVNESAHRQWPYLPFISVDVPQLIQRWQEFGAQG